MSNFEGLRVTVEGDLAPETMLSIADSVRSAVLDEVARLDIAPPLREWPLDRSPADFVSEAADPGEGGGTPDLGPIILGIILLPAEPE